MVLRGTKLRGVRIAGAGMYVPENVVTNQDLEKYMDTSDAWIQERSGIRERRYAPPGLGASDLAKVAAERAIAQAGLTPKDIDLIVFATLSPDVYFPGSSVFLQDALGLDTTPAMDIRCQCSGFLYGLNVAQLFVASGQYDRVLLVGAETHSRGLNFSTAGRDVTVLFGDGAGAVVLAPTEVPEAGILSVHLHAQGEFRDKLMIEYPSMRHKPFITESLVAEGAMWPKMEGRFVFKHAVTRMPEVVHEALRHHHLTPDDIDLYLFHQANLRINEAVIKSLGQPMTKTFNNIDRYGNCSAASIPMCLAECIDAGRIRPGNLICMASFGSGFTWGAALMRWA